MGQRVTRPLWVLICFAIFATLGSAVQTSAQDRPRDGGELAFVVAAEPPGFDAHREEWWCPMTCSWGPSPSTTGSGVGAPGPARRR